MRFQLKRAMVLVLCLMLTMMLMAGCSQTKKPASSSGSDESLSDISDSASSSLPADDSEADVSESQQSDSESVPDSSQADTSKTTSTKSTVPSGPVFVNKYNPYVNVSFDYTKAEMPSRSLKNKVVTYYSWVPFETSWGKDSKSLLNVMKKEHGVTFKLVKQGTHETYWDTLALLKASAQSPDLVQLPNWDYYPIPITEGLIQPMDGYIDFSNPMWADTAQVREANKWNGKIYVAYCWEQLNTWFFYNKKMFKDYGLSNKTPLDYYNDNNWTWEVMQELADKFVKKNSAGEYTQWGFSTQTCNLLASTGLELVKNNGDGTVQFNLRDAKVAKLMNMFYDMSPAGSGSLRIGNTIEYFRDGRIAMCTTTDYAMNYELNQMRLSGNLGWVPLPKMDKNSEYYNETRAEPGFAIATGASNPEGAALTIEMHKWYYSGYPFTSSIPREQRNACMTKYKIPLGFEDESQNLSQAEIDYSLTFISKKYKNININWQSWLQTQNVPGFAEVGLGTKKWSTVLEEIYPIYKATLDSYAK